VTESKSPLIDIASDFDPLNVNTAYWHRLCEYIHAKAMEKGVHLSRCVVLLPFAQLMPLARRHWAQVYPSGFVPQFQTTSNWANQLRPFAPEIGDISVEMAQDVLKAAQLLKTAKLDVFAGLDATQQDLITTRLVEAAHQLAASAAAVHPQQRLAWADEMRRNVFGGMVSATFANESSIAQLALYWASTSSYASDVLFDDALVKEQTDYLFVLEGLQRDPLARALMVHWGNTSSVSTLMLEQPNTALPDNLAGITLYPAKDAHDEAQLAAACVLRHIEAGRMPVAIAATDRALTRRILAMLATQNIAIRDENGWILSTTRAAAKLMAYLKACAWNASTDSVLDFLKNSDAKIIDADELAALEKAVRKANRASWASWVALVTQEDASEPSFPRRRESTSANVDSRLRGNDRRVGNDGEGGNVELLAATQKIETARTSLQSPRILSAWLLALRTALESNGLLQVLQDDLAGVKVLEVLHIHDNLAKSATQNLPQSPDRWSLAEFTAWVNTALESTSYKPPYPDQAQAVILPMSQLLARPFAAAVLAGCDEARFDPSPMLPGQWSPAERLALGLITRDEQDAATRAAWHIALQTPVCDVLWRKSESTGEPVLPSSLVQSLQLTLKLMSKLNQAEIISTDPRTKQVLEANPTPRPQPNGSQLPVTRLSASGYSKLRTCPYQFFALQQLGLKEDDELIEALDKREFGLWLHAVLSHFHENLKKSSEIDKNMDVAGVFIAYTAMLNIAKTEVTATQNIPEDAFLPWDATWPKLRDGYVSWLIGHQAAGWTFDQAEVWRELSIGNFGLKLVGQLDRIDKSADGTAMVLDYKTESDSKTAKRLKEPLEDTQLAFYAALVGDEMLEAAYVNVSDKLSKTYAQPDIDHSRSALIEGILDDMQGISAGKPLPALGEGAACDYCAARGLCRKDFW
jgi:ATP-dependent helicase/nuclease subunit B